MISYLYSTLPHLILDAIIIIRHFFEDSVATIFIELDGPVVVARESDSAILGECLHLIIYLSVCLSIYLSLYLSLFPTVCHTSSACSHIVVRLKQKQLVQPSGFEESSEKLSGAHF